MAFKPNYNFQKAERDRAKTRKKQEKLKRLQEESDKRKADRGDEADPDASADPDAPADDASANDASADPDAGKA